ncbi:hypothetical protein LguiB_031369 [Lonicera macranthoides]
MSHSFIATAISSCNDPCQSLNDCTGQLICIEGKCNDNSDVGTQVCQGSSPSPSGSLTCSQSGTHPTYKCSPHVMSSTLAALLTNNASNAGKRYHDNTENIVALSSTGWYSDGSRHQKMIQIRASNGKTTMAKWWMSVTQNVDAMRSTRVIHHAEIMLLTVWILCGGH